MNEEPSVLDYVKSKLNPWKYQAIEMPAHQAQAKTVSTTAGKAGQPAADVLQTRTMPAEAAEPRAVSAAFAWPWRPLLALALALFAQSTLEPQAGRSWSTAVIFYGLALGLAVWANLRGELRLAAPAPAQRRDDPRTVHQGALLAGIPAALVAFLAFGGNRFTSFNLLLWGAAFFFLLKAFWLGELNLSGWFQQIRRFLARPHWRLTLSRWTLLLAAVAVLAVFFRTYQLGQVPPEMTSDHAEKLLDVADVLNGETRIFFPRNTGREPLQFYLTAAIASIFGTGVSFTSLKIGTILAGLLTLPYIYLLGKEVGGKEVGLWALAFAAIAYWPNVISRIALRFTLYPLFVAPTLYYLIRGLRRSNRNDFILSGIALGIGLHGYTAIRILPFVVVIAVGLFLLHRQSAGVRKISLVHLGLLALVSAIIFLPLLRFAQTNPDLFAFRAFSRLGDVERPLPGPAGEIFLSNLGNALKMFHWDNGDLWTVSVAHRPALDVITGALFLLGIALLLVRYLRRRNWLDLFLILSIPLLMMPSILSLAFPNENPVLNRTGGAIVPVFLITGISLQGLLSAIKFRIPSRQGTVMAWGLGFLLLALSAFQNYDLVFEQYAKQYDLYDLNTSEIGQVIRGFGDSIGSTDHAWVVPYPYWVDTRLVGINAGTPRRDYALWPEHFADTLDSPGPKLFILKTEDVESILALRQLYPAGRLKEYQSKNETQNFYLFFVPQENG